MKDQAPDETAIERLRAALESDALPPGARDHARHLLKRLSSPVRVTLLGRPGSGKSELVNMFVGRRLIPKGAALPTLELVHGAAEKLSVTASNGTVTDFDGISFDKIAQMEPAFLRLQLPLPLLERISLLEVVTEGSVGALNAAVDWAVRRTDIALWCSQDFNDAEQTLWTRVPDGLKDHAFLVLTKADVLSADKRLSNRVAELETIVSEEFHSLFAVATLQAIKAHKADGSVDEAMRHASGGGALTSEILRHAERGRRADIDSAELFLARYQIPAQKRTSKQVETSKPAAEVAPRVVSKPVTEVASETPPKAKPTNIALFSDAVRFLRKRGDGFTESAQRLGEGKASGLVDQCVDAVEHLVDLFSQDDSGCPASDAIIDELMEATDHMVLMQSETGDAPAADAVTLLLQLRRDMEEKIAA